MRITTMSSRMRGSIDDARPLWGSHNANRGQDGKEVRRLED
jgi:hypothetical protein